MKTLIRYLLPFLLVGSLLAQSTPTVQVDTWAALKALTIPNVSGKLTALVKGRVTANDGAGDIFFYDSASVLADDGGTVATPNVGAGAWIRQYSGPLNVKWFGVVGNGIVNDTVSLQRAYDAVHALGGGQVFFPKAAVTLNASITNYANIITKGSGVGVTVITFSNAGDGFVTSSPINTSTPLYSSYKDIEVVNSNGANTGGGIVDVAGTYGEISGCFVHGFKYEVILDQSELWRITGNTFTTVINNGADIWMVEGADRTVGALPGYCNGIWIKNNQFNNAGTTTSIIADGYDGNVISDNNFNAGSIGLRIGRACAIIIRGNNFEGQTSYSVQFNNTTSLGTSVVTSIGGLIQGNQFQSSVPVPLFLTSVYGVEIADNSFLQMATAGIQFDAPVSARNCYVHDNNKLLIGNGRTAAPFVSASTANYQDNQIAQLGQTYSVNSFGAGAQTVTVGTVEGFNANQTLFVVNADGSNPEQVVISTVVNSTSFTATFGLAHATNCLFHCIDKTTQNPVTFLDSFSTKQQKYVGQTAPALSAIGSGSIYFDSVTNVFNVSQNGGAYVPLISSGAPASTLVGPLTATAIPYASGTTNLANSPISRLSATDVGPTTDNGSTLGDTTHRWSGIFAMPLNASSNTLSLYDSTGAPASVFGPAGGLTLGGQVPPGAGNLSLALNTSTIKLGANSDVVLNWDAANAPAFRNGTNAQDLRVFETTDGAGNAGWVSIRSSGSKYQITPFKSGTGALRTLTIGSINGTMGGMSMDTDGTISFLKQGSAVRWVIDSNGVFTPATDAGQPFGSAALRVNGVTSTIYTANAGSISSDTPNVFSQQWNSGGVTFHGLQISVTNTASASGSELLQFNVGGSEKGSFQIDGRMFAQYFTANLTAKPNYVINSAGSNFGQINNIDSHTWGLGYGATATSLGTEVITWTDNSGVGINSGVSSFKNVSTAGSYGVPAIYGANRVTGQTAGNTNVVSYANGPADGSFEVSANVLVTTSSAEAFSVQVLYTDEGNTARTQTLPFVSLAGSVLTQIAFANGAVPYEGCVIHLRVKASTTIYISVPTSGTFTGVVYNVGGIIKQTQ